MKTKLLQVRIEPDKIHALKLRAEELGMSVSKYVRYLFEMDTNEPDSVNAIMTHANALRSIVDKFGAESVEIMSTKKGRKVSLGKGKN